MSPERITPAHVVALAEYVDAKAAFTAACEVAASEVAKVWPTKPEWNRPHPLDAQEAWWSHELRRLDDDAPPQEWPEWDLGWDVFANASRTFPALRPSVCIVAGLSGTDDVLGPALLNDATWRRPLERDYKFGALETRSGKKFQFRRYAYPEEVLAGTDVEEQGHSLARWVSETFDALYAKGPPPALRRST